MVVAKKGWCRRIRQRADDVHLPIDVSFVRIRAKPYVLLRASRSSQWKKGLIEFRVM